MSKKNRILLVDDELNILKSYQRALRNEPYEVTVAESAEVALDLVRKTPFDLIISDFRMPGMNGIEFLKATQELSPDSVRAILSGFADESAVEEALHSRVILRYLLKPIENSKFKEVIQELLS
jgi:two-component system NtrC family sensor kinase